MRGHFLKDGTVTESMCMLLVPQSTATYASLHLCALLQFFPMSFVTVLAAQEKSPLLLLRTAASACALVQTHGGPVHKDDAGLLPGGHFAHQIAKHLAGPPRAEPAATWNRDTENPKKRNPRTPKNGTPNAETRD